MLAQVHFLPVPADAPIWRDPRRRAGLERAAADWLQGQARVIEMWRERLLAADGDADLIAVFDVHAEMLNEVARRIGLEQGSPGACT